jgi:hypothetical protein
MAPVVVAEAEPLAEHRYNSFPEEYSVSEN